VHTRPIVVGYDDSPGGRSALRWATDAAIRHRVPLRLVHTVHRAARTPTGPPLADLVSVTSTEDAARRDPHDVLARAVDGALARASRAIVVTGAVATGPASAILCDESARARLVVIGRRRALGRHRGGATCVAVTSHAGCPVVVVPDIDPADSPTGPVVVGVGCAAEAHAAVGFAFEEAVASGAAVAAIRVWSPPPPPWRGDVRAHLARTANRAAKQRSLLADALVGWQDKHPSVPATASLVAGDPGPTLTLFSLDARLLVVGRDDGRQRSSDQVIRHLLHHADCPVAVVPA
jgi:nucleotide-binding universal stress UspA family protein